MTAWTCVFLALLIWTALSFARFFWVSSKHPNLEGYEDNWIDYVLCPPAVLITALFVVVTSVFRVRK